ncbi:hypothetical protein WJX81_000548 [Elliptochloris bilobata]|uniref:Calponin-homology (CH) domain-containing protein n=1 Tax=Elliptochloris bilobata TaxID=381761 RepID=A0AAW1SG19_9CHLO
MGAAASQAAAPAGTDDLELREKEPEDIELDTWTRLPPLPCAEPGSAEAEFCVTYINTRLGRDPALAGRLPLAGGAPALFNACSDGVLLCKLLNTCAPDSIDERAVNLPTAAAATPASQSCEDALQNCELALNAARAAGCSLSAVAAEDVASGSEAAISECLWQFIRLGVLQGVSVRDAPALAALRRPGEDVPALLDAPPEQLLLRWLAHHLAAAGPAWDAWLPLRDMGAELADSTALACLLGQIAPELAPVSVQGEPSLLARAEAVRTAAAEVTSEMLPPARAIAEGNAHLNVVLLAALFRARPALGALGAAGEQTQLAAGLEEYSLEDSREERTFRVWLQSLLRDEVALRSLAEGLRDGYWLLRVLDALAPGAVDWRTAHRPPLKPLLRRPLSIENCNQVVRIARRLLGLPLVNIGGVDIVGGRTKLLAAILWQLMRFHTRALLQSIAPPGRRITDAELDRFVLSWANARAAAGGKARRIGSFSDPSLASGLFLVDQLSAIEPGSVNFALVTPGGTPAERELNAKYLISSARKMGCLIFLLWEDVVEVNSRMLLVFVASLMVHTAARAESRETA